MRKRLTQTLALFLAISVLHACKKPGVNHEGRETSREVPADAVTVRISYGSEKKAFLVDAIDGFHRSNAKTQSGKVIRIQATAEGSAESMEAILAGQSDAHVWSPASSLLVDVLNARWAEKQGQLGGTANIVADAPPLALSRRHRHVGADGSCPRMAGDADRMGRDRQALDEREGVA